MVALMPDRLEPDASSHGLRYDAPSSVVENELRHINEALDAIRVRLREMSSSHESMDQRLRAIEGQHDREAAVKKWINHILAGAWMVMGGAAFKLIEYLYAHKQVLIAAAMTASVVLFAHAAMSATTYYVSPTGSNSAAGTIDAPWQTIGYAASIAGAGDTVTVLPGSTGVYAAALRTTKSGTASARITFVASPPGSVTIKAATGNTATIGWENLGDYVTIDGFVIDGTPPASGTKWRVGIATSGLQDRVTGSTVTTLGRTETCDAPVVGIQATGANATVTQSTVKDIGPSGGC